MSTTNTTTPSPYEHETTAPTPRCDAVTMDLVGDYYPEMLPYTDGNYVPADFARTLERELAAKDAEIARLSEFNTTGAERLRSAIARAEKAEAEVAQIAQILPKRGHDTIGAARDVMQDLAENRAALAAAKLDTERLAGALNDATTSLCTLAQQSGRTEELREFSQIRGYAFSRYSAAIDAARSHLPESGKAQP